MKRKKIILMLTVLAVCCAATLAATGLSERQENIRSSEEIILALEEEGIKALAWEYGSTALAYHKNEEGLWLYDEDEAFPVNADKISELLELFEEFGVSFIIEEAEDLSPYGLDEPSCRITIATAEESHEILLGDFSKLDEKRYVSIGDGNVYLVNTDPMEKFEIQLSDTIEHDQKLSFDSIRSIQFEGTEAYTITYAEESIDTYCSSDRYFTTLDGKPLPLDTYRVEDYLSAVTTLSLTDYVSYHASEEELAEYGLDEPEASITIAYSYEDEEGELVDADYLLHVSRSAEEREKNPSPNDVEEDVDYDAYVRIGQSQILYEISADKFKSLMACSYNDLRHREIFTADAELISGVEIELEGETYSLTVKEYDADREKLLWLYQEEELDSCGILPALQAVKADHFTNEKADGEIEIAVTVYLNHDTFSEVNIELTRYNGEHCLAQADGVSIALVPRTEVVDLIEAVHAIVLN